MYDLDLTGMGLRQELRGRRRCTNEAMQEKTGSSSERLIWTLMTAYRRKAISTVSEECVR